MDASAFAKQFSAAVREVIAPRCHVKPKATFVGETAITVGAQPIKEDTHFRELPLLAINRHSLDCGTLRQITVAAKFIAHDCLQ
jgi:hypothetical protein